MRMIKGVYFAFVTLVVASLVMMKGVLAMEKESIVVENDLPGTLRQVAKQVAADPVWTRRVLAGNFDLVNSVLEGLEIDLDVSGLTTVQLPEAEVVLELLGSKLSVDLWFYFIEPFAVCRNFSIADVEISYSVQQNAYRGMPITFPFDLDITDPLLIENFGVDKEAALLSILVQGITVACDIPIRVLNSINNPIGPDSDLLNPHEMWQILQYATPGTLTINTTDADFRFGASLRSKGNFTYNENGQPALPPGSGEGQAFNQCNQHVMFNELSFQCLNLGFVDIEAEIGIPIVEAVDLDVAVCDALNGDRKEVAERPVTNILCTLTKDVGGLISDLLADNLFTELPDVQFNYSTSDFLYVLRPAGSDRINPSKALELESSFPTTDLKLVDIGDNFVTDLVGAFPDGSPYLSGDDPTVSILGDVYEFLTDIPIVEGIDPIFNVFDEFLKTTFVEDFTANRSTVLDVFAIGSDLLGTETINNTDGISFDLRVLGTDASDGTERDGVNFTFTVRNVILTITPREDKPVFERDYLERLFLLGKQTIRIPAIEGFDMVISVDISLFLDFFGGAMFIDDTYDPVEDYDPNDILPFVLSTIQPFSISEEMVLMVDWVNVFFETSAVVAIDETLAGNLEIGPFLNNILDCVLSAFHVTPRISSAVLNADGFNMELSGAEEALIVLVQDALFVFTQMYQGAIPGLIEEVLNSELVNQELIEPLSCPVSVDNGEFLDWRGWVFDAVYDLLSAETVSTLLELLFSFGEAGTEHEDFIQIISPENKLELISLENLPSENGLNITLEFNIVRIEVKGLTPANWTTFNLLDLSSFHSGDVFNSLLNQLAIGSEANPIILGLEVELNTLPDETFDRRLRKTDDSMDDSVLDAWLDGMLGDDRDLSSFEDKPGKKSLFPRGLQGGEDSTQRPTQFPTTGTPTQSPETPRPTRSEVTPKPTPLPPGSQFNTVRLEATLSNVTAMIDLYVKVLEYDMVSTIVDELLEIWCWTGKLQEPGGIKDMFLYLNGTIQFTCIECMNEIVASLGPRFNNPEASKQFFIIINELLGFLSETLIRLFDEEWDATVTDLRRWCQGLDSVGVQIEFGRVNEDLSRTYSFLGFAVIILGVVGCTNCKCINSTHEYGQAIKKGKKAPVVSKEEIAKRDLEFLEKHNLNDHIAHELEHIPLYRNPCVPILWQVFIPFLLLMNFGLFIIGHVGQAVAVSLFASIAGAPIELDGFQTISVIESAEAVWNSGGIFLALLIIIVSVMWPYVKILGMTIGWFAPTWMMNFHRRGGFIRRLDQLGKWSLIELYLLLFILVTFRLEIESPANDFLPKEFWKLSLDIQPQLSIFTFTTALIISLFTSNVIEWYQEKVEKKIATINREPQKTDYLQISMSEYLYPTTSIKKPIGFTVMGILILVVIILTAIVLTLTAAMLPVLGTEVRGVIRLAYDLERKETFEEYSLFRFSNIILGNSPGEIYLGVFFFATVALVPVMQLVCLLKMLVGRFSLENAIFWYDVNVMLSAWSCSEVFAVGVGVTVMELGQVSGSIANSACTFLQPFMYSVLVPLGLIDEIDVNASCFTLLGTVEDGLIVLFAAVVLANIAHFAITITFLRFIQARLAIREGVPPNGRVITSIQKFFLSAGCLFQSNSSIPQEDDDRLST